MFFTVLLIGLTTLLPFTLFSQKSLKLNLQKNIESESSLTIPSLRSTQKQVTQIELCNSKGEKECTLNIWYDNSGRVVKSKTIGNTPAWTENAVLFYDVEGKKLTISGYNIDPVTEKPLSPKQKGVICELNDMGYIVKEEIIGEDGSHLYEYDENGQTIFCTLKSGKSTWKNEYTWIDGNIHILAYKLSDDHKYTYTPVINKANINLNKIFTQTFSEDIWQFALFGYVGNADRNLIASIDDEKSFEYFFDNDGYVSIIKSYYGEKLRRTVVITYDNSDNIDPDPTPGNPTTGKELEEAIEDAPEGTEDNPTEIFIPTDGITLDKPLDIQKHIRLKGGVLERGQNNPYALLRIRSGFSLELQDITIDGNQVNQMDGSLIVYGKLKLKDGVSIKNCSRTEANAPSGTICIAQNGILNMDGGTIFNNTGAYGGAVYNEGTFTMTGGEILANESQIGAIVNNAGGKFNMTGGKISGNKVTEGCGGVFIDEDCSFSMTGGEISGNEDCAIYTWADLWIGGSAKADGLLLLNDKNRLLVNPSLQNNWLISYVDVPKTGAVVAVGYNGYQLTQSDLKKFIYKNDECQLTLSENSIITYQNETGNEQIEKSIVQISVSGSQVSIENLVANSAFSIHEIGGRTVLTRNTDESGRAIIQLNQGLYILKCKQGSCKFVVKP